MKRHAADRVRREVTRALCAGLLALGAGPGSTAGTSGLYRYRDEDGVWHFTDRPRAGEAPVAEQSLATSEAPGVDVERLLSPPAVRLINRYHLPVQVALVADPGATHGGAQRFDQVIGARESVLVPLPPATGDAPLRHGYVLGDPTAEHRPRRAYRIPWAVSTSHRITQGFNGGITHLDEASRYAIDIAMPVGTGIFAAREGIVVETAWSHYEGGLDLQRDGPRANLVRILHDDGTYAVYVHLDRASVRVRPGQRVGRGELIAASGNTGFSSGPHLHFAVLRNAGMRAESVPFEFAGAGGQPVTPVQGTWLQAYT